MDTFTIALIAFSSTLLFSLSTIFSKFLITDFKNPAKFTIYQLTGNLFFASIPFAISFYLEGYTIFQGITLEAIGLIIASSFVIYIGLLSLFTGLIEGDTSVVGVINSSRIIFSILIAFFLIQDERYDLSVYPWIIIIFIGVLFVSWSEDTPITNVLLLKSRKSGYFLATIFLFAFSNSFVRLLNNSINTFTLVVIRLLFMIIFSVTSYNILKKFTNYSEIYEMRNLTRKETINLFFYLFMFTIADILVTFTLGESITITESMGALQGAMVFILINILLFIKPNLLEQLQEPRDKKTLGIRLIGIIIALIGSWNLILLL